MDKITQQMVISLLSNSEFTIDEVSKAFCVDADEVKTLWHEHEINRIRELKK